MRALTVLYRIRSYTLFVVEQVEKWVEKIGQDRGGMMNTVIARAQYELRNVKWLQEKMERLQEGNGDKQSGTETRSSHLIG